MYERVVLFQDGLLKQISKYLILWLLFRGFHEKIFANFYPFAFKNIIKEEKVKRISTYNIIIEIIKEYHSSKSNHERKKAKKNRTYPILFTIPIVIFYVYISNLHFHIQEYWQNLKCFAMNIESIQNLN